MSEFKIGNLDHVAIRVKDIEAAANWYTKVLGLKRYQTPEWGPFPVFMLSGKTGIALFPANMNDTKSDSSSLNIKIDHFAFNVTKENFAKAKIKYDSLNLNYQFKDHIYFHSIYTKDLDGHIVELTTLVVDENSFY